MTETFSHWIGRETLQSDVITPRLVAQWRATLSPFLFDFDGMSPLGLHWALAPILPSMSGLGPDGAEAKGLFLPPVPLPRRMWAGGLIESFAPLRPGAEVTRRSTISDISWREGRSGKLCLVSIAHVFTGAGQTLLRERQDLVFRQARPRSDPAVAAAFDADLAWTIDIDAPLLFRLSALTFNSHRIHYDHPYAVDQEGYAGLVAHGPLQAALLLNQAACLLQRVPRRFEYRCLAPLIAGQLAQVESRRRGAAVSGRIRDAAGVATIKATATS